VLARQDGQASLDLDRAITSRSRFDVAPRRSGGAHLSRRVKGQIARTSASKSSRTSYMAPTLVRDQANHALTRFNSFQQFASQLCRTQSSVGIYLKSPDTAEFSSTSTDYTVDFQGNSARRITADFDVAILPGRGVGVGVFAWREAANI